MSHSNTVLAQLLKLLPRHEIETLANQIDGKRRSDAMTRWTQLVKVKGVRPLYKNIDRPEQMIE